jgi:hypothetical protein
VRRRDRRGLRQKRVSYKLHTTAAGKIEEKVTTVIARNMAEVYKLDYTTRRDALKSLEIEIENISIDYPAVVAVNKEMINEEEDEVLPAGFVIAQKYTNGVKHDMPKARIVARGDKQLKEDFRNQITSTVNTEAIMLILAFSNYKKRVLMTMDIKGAYLNAKMENPKGCKTFLKFNRDIADVFCKIHPSTNKLRRKDGAIYLRADRALYGCIQSSYLWQRELTKVLVKEMCFKLSCYDNCVAISDNGRIIVAFHVDDLLVSCVSLEDQDWFIQKMKGYFTLKHQTGNSLDYLGMHIAYVPGEYISLSQHEMIDKLVRNVHGHSKTPESVSAEDAEGAEAAMLSFEDAATYRSKVALCLYLAKRTRPDWLHTVNLLCRKAQNPDERDLERLKRLLRYASYTRNKVLRLECKELKLHVFIDASFATAQDRKSTTGVVIMLGQAVIWCKSGKQSIITKSSMEAELVALSDMASMALWMCLFLHDIGINIPPPIIYQDNQSTITVITKGLTSKSSTRHIDVRRLWIREVIDAKSVVLSFMPTEAMIADGFTKALSGEKFKNFVQSLHIV